MAYDANHIAGWDSTLPTGGLAPDVIDDSIREVKRAIERDTIYNAAIVTGTATIGVKDSTILCNSATPFTVTLPTASGVTGKIYIIKNISTGAVTIATNGSEKIITVMPSTGVTSVALGGPGSEIALVSDGTYWHLIMDKNFSYVKALSGNGDVIPQTTPTMITFQSESADYLGEFASTRFTAKFPGLYLIENTLVVDAEATGQQFLHAIHKNGSQAAYSYWPAVGAGGENVTPHVEATLPLAVGDYIEILVAQTCSPPKSRTLAMGSGGILTISKIG